MNLIDYNQAVEAIEKERQLLLNREQYGAENVLVHHALNVIAELPVIRQPQIVRKPVVGYEGIYEVDNFGRVFSVDRVKKVNDNGRIYDKPLVGKRIKQHLHSKGYKVVPLTKDGKTKTCFVHRIVAEAFIDNPNNLPMINHKDEDKTNNEADNLEWCDATYNMMYGNARAKRMKTLKKNHPDWFCADGELK